MSNTPNVPQSVCLWEDLPTDQFTAFGAQITKGPASSLWQHVLSSPNRCLIAEEETEEGRMLTGCHWPGREVGICPFLRDSSLGDVTSQIKERIPLWPRCWVRQGRGWWKSVKKMCPYQYDQLLSISNSGCQLPPEGFVAEVEKEKQISVPWDEKCYFFVFSVFSALGAALHGLSAPEKICLHQVSFHLLPANRSSLHSLAVPCRHTSLDPNCSFQANVICQDNDAAECPVAGSGTGIRNVLGTFWLVLPGALEKTQQLFSLALAGLAPSREALGCFCLVVRLILFTLCRETLTSSRFWGSSALLFTFLSFSQGLPERRI